MKIPTFDKIHNALKFNGFLYTKEALKEVAYSDIKDGLDYEIENGDFLLDWLSNKPFITVKTSGSTGTPKKITLSKQAMVHSALATGDYFNLKPGDKALLCLPANYIAGKMMLVRAMILGLDLDVIEPKTKLTFDTQKKYQFCALLPMQLEENLNQISNIENIIVGGAPVSPTLKAQLKTIKPKVFETYGMSETITHIAVKPLNGKQVSDSFETLPNVTVSTDKRGCLVINAPNILEENLVTNDIVKVHSETNFEWLGRYDNIINSGGVKLNPETIEAKLKSHIKANFFVASKTHKTLGEQLILVVEAEVNTVDISVFETLDRFEKPKHVYYTPKFEYTTSGKIQRKNTLKILKIV